MDNLKPATVIKHEGNEGFVVQFDNPNGGFPYEYPCYAYADIADAIADFAGAFGFETAEFYLTGDESIIG